MARFDLANYVTVDERIRRFYAGDPHSSIVTDCEWRDNAVIVKATVLRPDGVVWATGMAFTNKISGEKELEKCETTAIGRALANAGFVKEGEERASREEMADLETDETQRTIDAVTAKFADLEVARAVWLKVAHTIGHTPGTPMDSATVERFMPVLAHVASDMAPTSDAPPETTPATAKTRKRTTGGTHGE